MDARPESPLDHGQRHSRFLAGAGQYVPLGLDSRLLLRWRHDLRFTPVKGDDVVKKIGLQGVNPQGYSAMGFPTITITGIQQMRVNPGGVALNTNTHSFSNTTSWSTGGHVIKFGGELRWWRDFNDVIPEGTYGNFTFDGSIAGQAYAEFLLGMPTNSQRIDPLRARLRHAGNSASMPTIHGRSTAASRSITACGGTTSSRPRTTIT